MCWFHSPYVNDDLKATGRNGSADPSRPDFMDFGLCETIARELHDLGTPRAILGGWGDPLLHPQFDRILELLLKLGMAPYVITNGLALDEARARSWAQLPAHFRFSMHAGDAETWLKIHTGCAPHQFEILCRSLRLLVAGGKATVSVMHAVQKDNFRSTEKMVAHAHLLGVRQILFSPFRQKAPSAAAWFYRRMKRSNSGAT